MEATSQVSLRVTPDEAYLLMASMEVASCHDEFDGTKDDYLSLKDRLMLILEEHGEQGGTLEDVLR